MRGQGLVELRSADGVAQAHGLHGRAGASASIDRFAIWLKIEVEKIAVLARVLFSAHFRGALPRGFGGETVIILYLMSQRVSPKNIRVFRRLREV